MDSIRVVIADDHAMVREGIHQLLRRQGDIEIVAEVSDEAQVEKVVENLKPDILLLDPSLFTGLEALRAIHEKSPRVRILILTKGPPEEELLGYLGAGAKGAISKKETSASLAKAIRVIAAGETWAGRKVIARVIEELSALAARVDRPKGVFAARLSPRELRIGECVAQGHSNRVIAEQLRLSEKTVKNHLSNIFQKLGLQNRAQLTAFILQGHRKEQRSRL
jgi:DNA-binding NarL/FixJ family response regulator